MLNKSIITANLIKYEYYLFYVFLVINLLPLLVFKFFPTVDGPAHLYNSRLIIELLGQDSYLENYFTFNEIAPNWLGHIMLSIFQFVFPAYIAEKCLLLIYFIGFPVSFRAFIKIQPDHNNTLIYYVFPFTYSFLLYYGFYNFHIGLVLFFCTLYFWLKYKNDFTIKRTFFLLILTTLMCLSHLFVFIVFLFTLIILNIRELKHLLKPDKEKRKQFFNILIHQFLALSIGLLIMIKFIFTNAGNNGIPTFIKSSDLLKWLVQIQPAKGIVYGKEGIFTRWIFISLILLISYLLFIDIKRYFTTQRTNCFSTILDLKFNPWLILSFVFIVVLFVVPDSDGATLGFVSSRIVLFFFLFLIAWLSTKKFPIWLSIPAFIIISYVNIALLNIYYDATRNNNILTDEISKASLKIEPFKTVLPVKNSAHWLHGHASNYLGIDKPMVILENYEASLDYFPIRWNRDKIPNLYFGEMSHANDCLSWESNINNDSAIIDYIFILNDQQESLSNECANQISDLLKKDYLEVYKSKDNQILLYRFNQSNKKPLTLNH